MLGYNNNTFKQFIKTCTEISVCVVCAHILIHDTYHLKRYCHRPVCHHNSWNILAQVLWYRVLSLITVNIVHGNWRLQLVITVTCHQILLSQVFCHMIVTQNISASIFVIPSTCLSSLSMCTEILHLQVLWYMMMLISVAKHYKHLAKLSLSSLSICDPSLSSQLLIIAIVSLLPLARCHVDPWVWSWYLTVTSAGVVDPEVWSRYLTVANTYVIDPEVWSRYLIVAITGVTDPEVWSRYLIVASAGVTDPEVWSRYLTVAITGVIDSEV